MLLKKTEKKNPKSFGERMHSWLACPYKVPISDEMAKELETTLERKLYLPPPNFKKGFGYDLNLGKIEYSVWCVYAKHTC